MTRSPIHEPLTSVAVFLSERGEEQSRKGLIVWAKVDGHPSWPAMVVPRQMAPPSAKSNVALVNFFGTPVNQSFGYVTVDKMTAFHDFYDYNTNLVTAAAKKTPSTKDRPAELARKRAVELALEMQARLGKHVSEVLRDVAPAADAEAPTNACYCIYCFDGGELLMCDHCPASVHAACAGLGRGMEPLEGNYFCPPCLRYHLQLLLLKVEEVHDASEAAATRVKKFIAELKKIITRNNYAFKAAFLSDLNAVAAKISLEAKIESERHAIVAIKQQIENALDRFFSEPLPAVTAAAAAAPAQPADPASKAAE